MSAKRLFTAAIAVAFTVAAAMASAQPQHAEHHDAQDSRTADQDMSPMCPMMADMSSGGGRMGDMMGGMSGMGMGGMMGGGMMDLDAASLSEQQRERLAALHGRQAEEHFMLMMQMKEAQQRLQELSSAQPLDTDAVEQAYDSLAQARKEMFVSHLQARQQIREIVGPRESSSARPEARNPSQQ